MKNQATVLFHKHNWLLEKLEAAFKNNGVFFNDFFEIEDWIKTNENFDPNEVILVTSCPEPPYYGAEAAFQFWNAGGRKIIAFCTDNMCLSPEKFPEGVVILPIKLGGIIRVGKWIGETGDITLLQKTIKFLARL